ncbi:MAG: glutathione peroxidase [Oceanibaculum nanhaiense]|jgi:glutathione peroxidase|uniref:glutathione peroxidase n=1 Tax=Oceanibaculum nanhaiense TaxID=1909734 RepID=UPI0032ED4177
MAKKGLASFAGMLVAAAVSTVLPQAAPAKTGDGSGFDFSFESIDGGALPLDQYRGRPVLVVNTASRCGFTPQYEGLQALWEKYRDQGLVVLGVPSNDFGGQEPGSTEEIKQFCEVNFGIDFPMTAKYPVTGSDAHPFYRWIAQTLGESKLPRWNFYKYLIAPDGSIAAAWPSTVKPDSRTVTDTVETLLAK